MVFHSYRRFPVQGYVAYNDGTFIKRPLASCSGFGSCRREGTEWWPNNWGLVIMTGAIIYIVSLVLLVLGVALIVLR